MDCTLLCCHSTRSQSAGIPVEVWERGINIQRCSEFAYRHKLCVDCAFRVQEGYSVEDIARGLNPPVLALLSGYRKVCSTM